MADTDIHVPAQHTSTPPQDTESITALLHTYSESSVTADNKTADSSRWSSQYTGNSGSNHFTQWSSSTHSSFGDSLEWYSSGLRATSPVIRECIGDFLGSSLSSLYDYSTPSNELATGATSTPTYEYQQQQNPQRSASLLDYSQDSNNNSQVSVYSIGCSPVFKSSSTSDNVKTTHLSVKCELQYNQSLSPDSKRSPCSGGIISKHLVLSPTEISLDSYTEPFLSLPTLEDILASPIEETPIITSALKPICGGKYESSVILKSDMINSTPQSIHISKQSVPSFVNSLLRPKTLYSNLEQSFNVDAGTKHATLPHNQSKGYPDEKSALPVTLRQRMLELRFMTVKSKQRTKSLELQTFYKFNYDTIEADRQQELLVNIATNNPSANESVNSYYDQQQECLLTRIEQSLTLLEEKTIPPATTTIIQKQAQSSKSPPQDTEQCLSSEYQSDCKARFVTSLNPVATRLMVNWYERNLEHPYPSLDTCQIFAKAGGVSVNKVKKWFANRRMREKNTKSLQEIARERHRRKRSLCIAEYQREHEFPDSKRLCL